MVNQPTDSATDTITGWHAHVYYEAGTKETAAAVRAGLEAAFPDALFGRWHDAPVGPHPTGSFQVAFAPALFARVVPWLALNRRGLVVFVHPETGNDVPDHTDHAIWMGGMPAIDVDALR